MPARLWEVAKHGARGTIPQWVRAAPDAGATAPPRIGQIARRATQTAAAAGVVAGGIGIGIGATEVASHPVDLAHPGDGAPGTDHTSTGPGGGAPGADHTSTDPGTGSPASSDSGDAPGPQGGVTLHTSVDGGHLATGLATTWRIPGHGAVGGGHGEAGVEGGHDELTVDMYQDVVVHEGTDGMFSVDAVEYVVVHDEHGHAYVFRENYHTVVPDPPGQETDLIVHETDRAQVVEHRDGSFSVTHADNSIGVTVGSDGDGQDEVTVTQTESVQIGHDPHADGHDTASLTENEYGATTSDQTEVVTEQTLPPNAGPHQPWVSVPQPPIAGSMTSSTASMAASSQVGAGQSVPGGAFFADGVSVPPSLAPSLDGAGAGGGLGSGYEPHPARRGISRTNRSRRSARRAGRSAPHPIRRPQGRSGIRRRSRLAARRDRIRATARRSPAVTSLVWVIPVVTWVLIRRVWIWRGPGLGAMRAGLVGMRRRAGFIPVRRRAETRRRPGTIPASALPSSTDPRMGRKKGSDELRAGCRPGDHLHRGCRCPRRAG
jgi:hypothetical protein